MIDMYTDKQFLAKLKPFVINDMKNSGILASLTGAQAFIESNKGNSGLAVECNNLFGIKGQYQGQCKKYLTTEYYNGVLCRVYADFRKYPSWIEGIADHSAMFNRMSRYANLRGLKDYKLACQYVKQDGYATSPTYTQTLIKCIEKYKLYEWDGCSVMPDTESRDKPTLRIGSIGIYVVMLQTGLQAAGIYKGNIDGIYGTYTAEAVKKWQKMHGLKVDGVCGKNTWESFGV